MFRTLKPGFRSLATLKVVVNVVGELLTETNNAHRGIAQFPCDSMAFLYFMRHCFLFSALADTFFRRENVLELQFGWF